MILLAAFWISKSRIKKVENHCNFCHHHQKYRTVGKLMISQPHPAWIARPLVWRMMLTSQVRIRRTFFFVIFAAFSANEKSTFGLILRVRIWIDVVLHYTIRITHAFYLKSNWPMTLTPLSDSRQQMFTEGLSSFFTEYVQSSSSSGSTAQPLPVEKLSKVTKSAVKTKKTEKRKADAL